MAQKSTKDKVKLDKRYTVWYNGSLRANFGAFVSQPKPVVLGSKYNLLTVIEEVNPHEQPNGRLRRVVRVSCDCGSELEVMLENLYAGYSKSCGCLLREKMFKHGMSKTNFKDVHCNMKARCDNPQHPQYADYGGRGITYCKDWKDFTAFMNDMLDTYKEGLSLDRIRVDGNYEKDNCRWTDMGVQGHNKRKKDNTIFKFKGIRMNNGNPETLVAHIQIKGKGLYLASFSTEFEAGKAYDDASELLYQDRPNGTPSEDDWIFKKIRAKLIKEGVLCNETTVTME